MAALAHDIDHPGVTNAFLNNNMEPLSVLYNDSAPLENHHAATLFRLLQANPQANIFGRCNKDAFRGVRKLILDAVRELQRFSSCERPCELSGNSKATHFAAVVR